MTETNYLPHLSPDSYTGLRLQHATPEHLYLTTRRCFIGPIPQGWLRHHRLDWYKHHLHINYSSRAATFHASADTARNRDVSLLADTDRQKLSFPRPEALQEEDEPEQNQEEDDQLAPTTTESGLSLSIPRSSNRNDENNRSQSTSGAGTIEPTKPLIRKQSIAKTAANQPLPTPTARKHTNSTATSFVKPASSRRTSNLSFVTARETQSRADLDGQEDDLDAEQDMEDHNKFKRNDHGGSDSQTDFLSSPSVKVQISDSTKIQNGNMGLIGKLKAKVKGSDSSKDPAPERSNGVEVNKRRPRVGTVRFDFPQDKVEKERSVKRRLAQVSRIATIKSLRKEKIDDGEVVKLEKMLVRVEFTNHDLPPDFDENDSQKFESRTLEKWKEFMVVCRETDSEYSDFSLLFYKSRVIKAVETTDIKSRVAYDIPLNRRKVKVGLFSPLDKSIVVWEPYKNGNRFYIMRPRSGANAMEWFTFLRELLGHERTDSLNVSVPDLNVNLVLDRPFQKIELLRGASGVSDVDEQGLVTTVREEEAAARNIVKRCMDMLEKSPDWTDVVKNWAAPATSSLPKSSPTITATSVENPATSPARGAANIQLDLVSTEPLKRSTQTGHQPVGLAWKRYDRLEWVYGANEKRMYGTIGMERSHELELRPKQHYPTTVKDNFANELIEPPPVEGFLIRLTSQRGSDQKLGKLFYKRLYFSTHNHFLIFSRPGQADPPPPPKMPMTNKMKVPKSSDILEKIPLIYSVNPYQLDDDQIAWLDDDSEARENVINCDGDAFDEAQRVLNLLLRCDGNIDLCDVMKVRNVHRGAIPADNHVDEGSDVDFHEEADEDTTRDDGAIEEFDDGRTFELLMRNGLVVRLQAFDKMTKTEWMTRLRDLVKYWTLRCAKDIGLYKRVRQENLDILNIDEEMEALMGQFGRKWEVSKSYASTELYNVCGISCCRTVTMSGVLYRKARMHGPFVRNQVILSHGYLMIFKDTLRSSSGKKIPHIHHERVTSIELKNCYIYSGLITYSDLSYTERGPDTTRSVHQGLPRMYIEDGWSSTDEDTMTCFVLWHGKRSSWFRSNEGDKQSSGLVGRGQHLKKVSQLGTEGKSVVFKARSRAERDHWVMNIAMEIERLAPSEDVRIVVD